MLSRLKRDDTETFMSEWAGDLASLTLEAWPNLRYAAPRIIAGQPGILVTAQMTAQARYQEHLNIFLCLSTAGLAGFCRDDLLAYARFNAALGRLDAFCTPFGVDMPGGSQHGTRTKAILIDALVVPKRY